MADELKAEVPFESPMPHDAYSSYGGDADQEIPYLVPKSSHIHFHLDSQITQLKHSLRDWRELIVPLKSILVWDKQWHPSAIIGGSTIVFMVLWLSEPSMLTTISLLGLIVTLGDYLLPSLLTSFINSDNWSHTKEKQLEDICRSVVINKAKFLNSVHSFYHLRISRPKIYYGTVVLMLLFLAWIGSSFNNLFLTYLLVTSVLLLPGLEKQGVIPRYGFALTKKLSELAANTKLGKNKKEE